jgi:hypothetical protein
LARQTRRKFRLGLSAETLIEKLSEHPLVHTARPPDFGRVQPGREDGVLPPARRFLLRRESPNRLALFPESYEQRTELGAARDLAIARFNPVVVLKLRAARDALVVKASIRVASTPEHWRRRLTVLGLGGPGGIGLGCILCSLGAWQLGLVAIVLGVAAVFGLFTSLGRGNRPDNKTLDEYGPEVWRLVGQTLTPYELADGKENGPYRLMTSRARGVG